MKVSIDSEPITNKNVESSHSVVQWYAGKTILVTGGTGFMGKVLLEKLLRACPDIKCIYVLCRSKKGLSPTARINEMTKLPMFHMLQKTPDVFKKLVAVDGDVMKDDLGLSSEAREQLINEVSIIFHAAASLRLEATLKPSILHNTCGTMKILDLACEMKHLKAMVHLSTAFCHCEYEILEEKVYPCPYKAKDVIRAVQWMDESIIETITPKLLGPHPNCYTFSKRLTESLVSEYSNRIPVVITRPSIVTPAIYEPLPGWVDSLNGPVGVLVAAGKGVIRSMMVADEYCAEVIPVDVAINALITIAWQRGIKSDADMSVPVYNLSNGDREAMTWGEVLKVGKKLTYEYPFEAGLWYPNGTIRMNPITHYLTVFICQIIPAYFIDAIFFLCGQKTFMVRVQKRIYIGMQVLQYFTTRKWTFINENGCKLTDKLPEGEQMIFYMSNVNPDRMKYLLDVILGARQYVMKEPLETLPKARKQLRMFYWLDWIVQSILYGSLSWYIWKIFHLEEIISLYSPFRT